MDAWKDVQPSRCNCYNIMIVGVTGAGKSTACNFFLGREVFVAGGGAVSVTTESEACSGDLLGNKVLFIDTPGFSNTYQSNKDRMNDLVTALHLAQNGVHALGICFDGSRRYNTAADKTLDALFELTTIWPHAFILYTHAGDMGETEEERRQKLSEWIKEERCPEGMKKILKLVDDRYMTVESKARNVEYHNTKCKELLDLVDKIHKNNSGRLYDNEMLKIAKTNYEKVDKEKKKEKEDLQKTKKELNEYKEKCDNLKQQSDHTRAIEEERERNRIKIANLEKRNRELQNKPTLPTSSNNYNGVAVNVPFHIAYDPHSFSHAHFSQFNGFGAWK